GHPISTNARIIAASNRNLEDGIVAGTFRLDLFYRLNVFPIELPSLRERKADIPALVEYFIKRHATDAGKRIRMVDKKTAELFQSYAWPGNIRELQSVIERSVILCESEILSVDPSWLSVASSKLSRRSCSLAERLKEKEKSRAISGRPRSWEYLLPRSNRRLKHLKSKSISLSRLSFFKAQSKE